MYINASKKIYKHKKIIFNKTKKHIPIKKNKGINLTAGRTAWPSLFKNHKRQVIDGTKNDRSLVKIKIK